MAITTGTQRQPRAITMTPMLRANNNRPPALLRGRARVEGWRPTDRLYAFALWPPNRPPPAAACSSRDERSKARSPAIGFPVVVAREIFFLPPVSLRFSSLIDGKKSMEERTNGRTNERTNERTNQPTNKRMSACRKSKRGLKGRGWKDRGESEGRGTSGRAAEAERETANRVESS